MNRHKVRWNTSFAVCLAIGGVIVTPPAIAQITPDNTLGAERSQVIPNVLIRGELGDRIDGGALRGVNLFHSFSEFNVNNGQRVYFTNPVGVDNILTRVTGTNPSNILGKLGIDGTANLFLINPNGILFGRNATLDIRGSFTASTASSFTFPNGERFSATNPQPAPLLTVSTPIGLQFGTRTGQITNAGSLQVGQDLTLAAGAVSSTGQLMVPNGNVNIYSTVGDVDVKQLSAKTANLSSTQDLNLVESQLITTGDLNLQAQNTVKIRDSATSPLTIQAGGSLLIQGDQAVDIFALNHPNSGLFSAGNMTFRSSTPVIGDAHYWSGGNFRVENLDGHLSSLISPHDPVILANGDVSFLLYTGTSLHVLAGGSVSIPGYIWIQGADALATSINPTTRPTLANVSLTDGTQLVIDGNARPTVDIRAGIDWSQLGGLPGNFVDGFGGTPSFSGSATSADISVGTIFFDNNTRNCSTGVN